MSKFHITAAKEIKPCKEKSCRVKNGSYESLEAAEAALANLNATDAPDFANVQIPEEPEPTEEIIEVIEDEPVKAEEVSSVKTYFDDDEEFLAGDDRIIAASQDSALFEQLDNVVSWRLENFYDDEGNRRGKYSLRNDPPVFRIEGSDGASADFLLTKNLAITMAETFETVKRGYYGVNPKRKDSITQEDAKNKFEEFLLWSKANPVRAGGLALLIALFIFTAFVV